MPEAVSACAVSRLPGRAAIRFQIEPMNSPQRSLLLPMLSLTLALPCVTPQARANVYATNFKLNGSTNSLAITVGQEVNIGYILNEPASAGVTLRILRVTNVVRTLSLTNGAPGTSRGPNTVTWDGKNEGGGAVSVGDYAFSITAGSQGCALSVSWVRCAEQFSRMRPQAFVGTEPPQRTRP